MLVEDERLSPGGTERRRIGEVLKLRGEEREGKARGARVVLIDFDNKPD